MSLAGPSALAMPSKARGKARARPSSPQGHRLQDLGTEVERMSSVYQEVQRNREAHQKRLNEMLEGTVRNIKHAHFHMQQKSEHVKELSKSYTSKFDHDLSIAREALYRDLDEATAKMEQGVEALCESVGAAEAALQNQREDRIEHTEASLGPIRDEAGQLAQALKEERQARQLREQEQERLIADEVEAIGRLIDQEKFGSEQQLMELARWAEPEQQHASKQQCHLEKETRDKVYGIRMTHQGMAKERIDHQHQIIESIAGFVNRSWNGWTLVRFRMHLEGASGLQELEDALSASPAMAAA